MEQEILPVKLKITNCYLIRGSGGFIMVDTAPPKCADLFRQAMIGLSIDPAEIKMLFITHGHWDHWGSLHDIKNITGAPAAINHREKEWVENEEVHQPGGIGRWGKFVSVLLKVMPIKAQMTGTEIGIELGDEEYSLEPYGIMGRLLHTPGHTDGSMSLLLDSGEAFVGDLAMSGFPRLGGPGPFVLGKDINTMRDSWQLLLDAGARVIYPSHGNPFNAKILEKHFSSF